MAISKKQKEDVLQELVEKFQKAKSVVFTEYRGLSVKQVGDVRKQLKEHGVEYKVAKKTLLSLAAQQAGFKAIPIEYMEGPISAVFSFEDEVSGPKVIYKLGKEYEGLTLKGGIMDGRLFGAEEAIQLAQIPSREELLAKLVGSMKAPISGFHGVLYGTMRQFVGTLQAVVDQKQ
jgi:large subunit ribosomal protein L10